jgi:PDZ domain-containing protein
VKSVPVATERPRTVRPSSTYPSGAALVIAAAILVVALISLNIPYFAITPGPTEDVAKLVTISGAKTAPVNGELLLTTVSLHEIKIGEAVRGWFDGNFEIVSRSTIIPRGESDKEVEQRTVQQMTESQLSAAAAALTFLGYRVQIVQTVRVHDVTPKLPASKVLRPGDVIVGADGRHISTVNEFRAVVQRHKIGDSIGLRVMRGSQTINIASGTVASQQEPGVPVIGVHLQDLPEVKLPLAVKYKVLGIGGPSAGLMFALGIVDLLDPADLAHGRVIAGTGEIKIDGTVGPIGGVRQKVAGARRAHAVLFLAPKDELGEACTSARDLKVVGVANLREAITALRDPRFVSAHTCLK